MEITIQELHKYNSLVEDGLVPPILCILDETHMRTTPWVDEKDRVCQKCWACGTKIFLGQERADVIKLLIYKNINN
jgi:hypothetical protein